ncbi:hypothetical protein SAMN05660330_03133 [Desulforhopalus singaporensis]|uniref:Uncharacterized protein n=1 Tax=Desulforhopalus singaporensis TaxID=91360 RepID=A0A1H0TMB3_9BACT|nr:hypothetical protein SAMN05660330_03133 [Desulforhopalus singaporensis]
MLAIGMATAYSEKLCLPADCQPMATVDHRSALSNPALLSALSKKSFSRVNYPILACKTLRSGTGSLPESLPNTVAACLVSYRFQVVIWLGCTSHSSVNSAKVFSPRNAARATFALKLAGWLRRFLLAIIAPSFHHYKVLIGSSFFT